jgi:GNAT superfamily N-acetyltransferase
MLEYISYTLFFGILFILLIYIYIRLKFGFWAIQPVFHIYDIGYMLKAPGIINESLPEKNKYTNFKNIETILFSDLSSLQIQRFINLVKTNYLKNKDNIFSPQSDNIIPYLSGHNDKTFVSFYNEDYHMIDLKKGTTITDKKLIGIMTARPIYVFINNGNKEANFRAYYVDYLCVDKLYRKKGIAPQMIQTHEYNQRHQNKSISVSLFKRENELTGIVPICVYTTYGFPTNKWVKPNDLPGGNVALVECGPTNIHHLVDFLRLNTSRFDISIVPEIANVLELIKTKNLHIYMIIQEHNVLCCYYFRNSCTNLKKSTSALSCFASINCCKDVELFTHGYKVAFGKICETSKEYGFGYAVVEDISDNGVIIQNLQLKTVPEFIFPTAYFFYNYIYSTLPSKKTFIVN